MKLLARAGLLHGDELTVTGRTVGENLDHRSARARRRDGPPVSEPLHRSVTSPCSGILSPEGLGGEGGRHRLQALRGHAAVFAGSLAMEAVLADRIDPGDWS